MNRSIVMTCSRAALVGAVGALALTAGLVAAEVPVKSSPEQERDVDRAELLKLDGKTIHCALVNWSR